MQIKSLKIKRKFEQTLPTVAPAFAFPLAGIVVDVTPDFFLPAAVGLEFNEVRLSFLRAD